MKGTYDFSGWATRNDTECADGLTIRRDAFIENDGEKVPMVWNHQHNGPENVLGHAILENREDGVYAYCTFNDTEAGAYGKELVKHGDVNALSIYANKLQKRGNDVVHGIIREVSLVLAGANPGAFIDNVIAHGEEDGSSAVIFNDATGMMIMHSMFDDEDEDEDDEYEDEDDEETDEIDDDEEDEEINHSGDTVGEVFETLTDKQKTAVYQLFSMITEDEGEENMKHNVYDNDENRNDTLMHDALGVIIADGKRFGSLKESFIQHSAEYGIENIDWLQPEFKNVNGAAPDFIKRNPDAWVDTVMNGVHHTPFAKIKMMFADLREDEARAKGYLKGKLKKEEVFGLLKRQVEPTTIYKKQKLDRDDMIDITDFDVVSWLKGEMRMMLDEEIARAILFGDGRTALSDDKINESNIIPVCKDAALYNIVKEITPESGETLGHALINGCVKAQDDYEGSGNLTAFMAASTVSDMLLLEDRDGHRMYKDMRDLALAMGVDKIVKVPASIIPTDIYGVVVDLRDYNVGADKGGAVNMFDDFDIDYNQQKYLIETRCSGALTKPFSAITLKKPSGAAG